MFKALPNSLITYMFQFLTVKDINSLVKTCKRFSQIINEDNKFWMRETLRQYLSFDLEPYSELYDHDDYKAYIKGKVNCSPKKTWKKLLEEGMRNKINFITLLKQIVPKENAEALANYLYETLRQPMIPIANLKRETIICSTQTLFQNKLSEVLYEDSGMVSKGLKFYDETKSVIDTLQEQEKRIFQELLLTDKTEILKARWYMFDSRDNESEDTLSNGDKSDILFEVPSLKKASDNTEETLIFRASTSLLLSLYESLYNIFSHHCSTIAEYLHSLDNIYDLLAEYTARWKTYVCSILELENLLETFAEQMNKNYERIFEGYPSYPKFSIWRFMTKIWMKEVFEKASLNLSLNESFLRILNNHREKNIKDSLNNNFNGLNRDENKVEMPKCLYISLNTRRKKNSTATFQNSTKQLKNLPHTCYTAEIQNERKLLSSYLQSILDISLNEVNIHYLDCTNMPTNYPYQELEDSFLIKSNEFYNDYQQLFNESPNYFCQFLKSDCSLLSEILTERTYLKLETIQVRNGLQFIKEFLYGQISTIDEKRLEEIASQKETFNDQRDEVDEFIESVVIEIVEEATREESKTRDDFYNLPPIIEDEGQIIEEKPCERNVLKASCQNKEFIRKLLTYLDNKYPNLKSNFEYLKQRLEHFERIREKDESIKQHNLDKNIPCDMGDIDSLFYDLDKQIDIALLNKMYQDYKMMLKQQEKEECNHKILGGLPSPEEEEEDLNPPNLMRGNLEIENIHHPVNDNIDEDLDFLGLDNLTLRRTHN